MRLFLPGPAAGLTVGSNSVLSPADGLVSAVQPVVPPPEIGLGEAALTRISIFMNVFNVHVNRSPAEGEVAALAYRPGRFFNASLDNGQRVQ